MKQESGSPGDSGSSPAASTADRMTPAASAPISSNALLQYSTTINNNNNNGDDNVDVNGAACGTGYSDALYSSLAAGVPRVDVKQEPKCSPVNEFDARHMMSFYGSAAVGGGRQDFNYTPPPNAAHLQLM